VIGFIEMLDIAVFALASLADPQNIGSMDIRKLALQGRSISQALVREAMGMAGKNSMAVSENDPIAHAADVFQHGMHRLAVFSGETKQVTGVLTQTDVLRFIHHSIQNDGKFRAMGERRITECGWTAGGSQVFCVSSDAKVIEAIGKLATTRVSGLAVIDPRSGRLCGNFSASDLRNLQEEQFPMLTSTTVLEFLEIHSPASLKPIVEQEPLSLFHNIQVMLESKVHRIWLVDRDFKASGVITMTDIIRMALLNPSTSSPPTAHASSSK